MFDALPIEIVVYYILARLSTCDLMRVRAVCRRLRSAVNTDVLWPLTMPVHERHNAWTGMRKYLFEARMTLRARRILGCSRTDMSDSLASRADLFAYGLCTRYDFRRIVMVRPTAPLSAKVDSNGYKLHDLEYVVWRQGSVLTVHRRQRDEYINFTGTIDDVYADLTRTLEQLQAEGFVICTVERLGKNCEEPHVPAMTRGFDKLCKHGFVNVAKPKYVKGISGARLW